MFPKPHITTLDHSTTTRFASPRPGHEEPPTAGRVAFRTWLALTIGACILALGTVGCGGGGSSQSVPTIHRAANGSFYAKVKGYEAAKAACKQKSALAQQLRKLGVGPGGAVTTPGPLGYGTQVQTGPVVIALQYGAQAKPTAVLCGVPVPAGGPASSTKSTPSTTSTPSTSTPSTTPTPSTTATSAANVRACIEKAGFTVSQAPLDHSDKILEVTSKLEATSGGELHTVSFWKEPAAAAQFASQVEKSLGYRAFGTITIDEADTPNAKKIEGCFQ